MKIFLTGSHGVGKSTVFNLLKEEYKDEFEFIEEIPRKLFLEGKIKLNKEGSEEDQLMIFNKYLESLIKNVEVFSDRSLIDVLAYTFYLKNYTRTPVKNDTIRYMLSNIERISKRGKDDLLYLYFPIEFPLWADGVRPDDTGYQKAIDLTIINLHFEFKIPFTVVSGNIERRLEILKKTIEERKIGSCYSMQNFAFNLLETF